MAVEHKSPASQNSNESGDGEREHSQSTAEEAEADGRATEEPKRKEGNNDGDEDEDEDEGEKDDGSDKDDDSESPGNPESSTQVVPGEWQTAYSAPHNAWYFFNARTGETTWTNPLQDPNVVASTSQPPSDPSSATAGVPPSSTTTESMTPMGQAALEQGIDPELAFLDPSLAYGPLSTGPGAYTARFNAQTGRFTATDGRDPSHVSEYARAQRMSAVFFDVEAWEAEVAKRKAQEDLEGPRRKKKPTKADLVNPRLLTLPDGRGIDSLVTRNGLKRRKRRRRRLSMHGCENNAPPSRTLVLVTSHIMSC
jgi:hypothetical protein